jgi:arsenate reductase-like glutaredoxin family protein
MSKTLEELGYEKYVCDNGTIQYSKEEKTINFYANKEIEVFHLFDDNSFTMEELKAIYKYCEDNKWI